MGNQYSQVRFDERRAEELYKEGKTQKEIAYILGVSPKIIFNRFKKRGFICRSNHGKGKDNPNWRGKEAGYAAKHLRVQAARGKAHYCSVCGSRSSDRKYEWHSKTLNYDDIWDFMQVCSECHWKLDKKRYRLTKRKNCGIITPTRLKKENDKDENNKQDRTA